MSLDDYTPLAIAKLQREVRELRRALERIRDYEIHARLSLEKQIGALSYTARLALDTANA